MRINERASHRLVGHAVENDPLDRIELSRFLGGVLCDARQGECQPNEQRASDRPIPVERMEHGKKAYIVIFSDSKAGNKLRARKFDSGPAAQVSFEERGF